MSEAFARLKALTTPHLADACLRVNEPVRCAPASIRPIAPDMAFSGRVLPARHFGSVDIFLEVLEHAHDGDVLVVDNAGRDDEACIGDLVALEMSQAGCAGIVIDGFHRDTSELIEIGLPVFSRGSFPTGPQRTEPQSPDGLDGARVGEWMVTHKDVVIGDGDGIIFIAAANLTAVIDAAENIRDTERLQAHQMGQGVTFREQVKFSSYLKTRAKDASFSFRQHLRKIGGAIEE